MAQPSSCFVCSKYFILVLYVLAILFELVFFGFYIFNPKPYYEGVFFKGNVSELHNQTNSEGDFAEVALNNCLTELYH